jgi:hypothetical protein
MLKFVDLRSSSHDREEGLGANAAAGSAGAALIFANVPGALPALASAPLAVRRSGAPR